MSLSLSPSSSSLPQIPSGYSSRDLSEVFGHSGSELPDIENKTYSKRKENCLNLEGNQETIFKIFSFMFSATIFGTSSYYFVNESLGKKDIKILTLCALFNGATIPSFFHLDLPKCFSKGVKREINKIISSWAYEGVFAGSQVFLNLVPAKEMKVFGLPFIWWLGVFIAKDISSLISLKQSDLLLNSYFIDEHRTIATLGFHTGNCSFGAKAWLTAQGVTAIGLTILNFYIDELKLGDVGKIGFFQDLIALFSGSVAGDILTQIFDNYRIKAVENHRKSLEDSQICIPSLADPSPSENSTTLMKISEFAKTSFILFTPLIITGLLAINTQPNTGADYLTKFTVGALYGGSLQLARREFESVQSDSIFDVHSLRTNVNSGVEKIQAVAKKYIPSAGFFSALLVYMGYAAITNVAKADYAIVVFLATTLLSFILTDRIASNHNTRRDNFFFNEVTFRLIFASTALSVYFQYLTSKLNIGDRNLNKDSDYLYALDLSSWFFLGLIVGNNRAVNIQPRALSLLPITPPIAMQELFKRFTENFH